MHKKIYTNTIFVVLAALLCTALWGSATPFIKTGYECLKVTGTPSIMLFAGIRFALAGIITVIICSIIERRFLFPKKKCHTAKKIKLPVYDIGVRKSGILA